MCMRLKHAIKFEGLTRLIVVFFENIKILQSCLTISVYFHKHAYFSSGFFFFIDVF